MRRTLLAPVLVLLACLLLERATDRWGGIYDLTAERSLSLTDETKAVVDALDGDVRVTAFLRRDQPGRTEAAALLQRYRRLNRHIRWRVLDPDERPGEVRRLGIDPLFGGVAVEEAGDREVVPTATEADVTAALVRLERDVTAQLCVTEGHGELSIDDSAFTGLSRLAALWRDHGYTVRGVDLLAEPSGAALEDCDATVVAFPTSPLGRATAALRVFLERAGRLLVLADPDAELRDLDRLLDPYGLGLGGGIVLEHDPAAAFEGDEAAPIVSRYSSGNPVVRNLPPTFFPAVTSVDVDDTHAAEGLTVARLADTSPRSELQRPGTTTPGPITVAAAADRSRVTGGSSILRTRVLVVGDADFATNGLLDQAGNSRLLVQAADWLTLDENLVSVSTNLAAPRPLLLTDARRRYALALSVLVVPGLFATAGGLVWAVRRNR